MTPSPREERGAGGTGLAGRLVVDRLQRDGHDPVVLARARGVDLMTSEGLAAALKGADVVIDVTSVTTTSARKSVDEIAGPNVESLVDMARRLIKRRNQRRPVVPLRLPGHAARAAATGALLPEGPGPRGTQTFDQWLREQGS